MKSPRRAIGALVATAAAAVTLFSLTPAASAATTAEPVVSRQEAEKIVSQQLNIPVEQLLAKHKACEYVTWYLYYADCVRAGQQSGRNWGCIQSAFGWYNLYYC